MINNFTFKCKIYLQSRPQRYHPTPFQKEEINWNCHENLILFEFRGHFSSLGFRHKSIFDHFKKIFTVYNQPFKLTIRGEKNVSSYTWNPNIWALTLSANNNLVITGTFQRDISGVYIIIIIKKLAKF